MSATPCPHMQRPQGVHLHKFTLIVYGPYIASKSPYLLLVSLYIVDDDIVEI